ncbi:helix-turn-helix domain-containing protein [Flavivirga abyssicola]|uniref:AraC-like ligand-binding domain-containing protein n=1 Tax=Flavivirga abyssicola TaxID=3063533 RepID=UPI0026DFE9EA|nr:helix-turn-helix domain-containing protein [Flavivirga sp. MEBiC07777]WVK11697.1 helix-turn-helix domain-containing protein [Flavivirga sp. MEBiC07777]
MQAADYYISTQKVAPKDALSYWNDYVCQTLIELDVFHNGGQSSFFGSLVGHQLDTIHVCKITSQGSGVRRSKSLIAKSSEDYFLINFQLSGQSILKQDGRTVVLKPNDWSFTDSTRPYELNFKGAFEQLVLKIPRRLLTYGTSYVTANTAQLLDDSGLGKILKNFIYSLSLELKVVDVFTRKYLANNLLQLLNDYLNLKFTSQKNASPSKETMLLGIKSFVEEQITNPQLSIQQIARTFKCSKRQLHKLFNDENCTINNYIRNSRLEKCKKDIENLGLSKLSISEIGYKNGFNNISNFTKCFKQKFGIPPGEYRTICGQSLKLNRIQLIS